MSADGLKFPDKSTVIKVYFGWYDLSAYYDQFLAKQVGFAFPAPPSPRLTPEQRLLLAMIINALESFQKTGSDKDYRWLVNDGLWLTNWLPTRSVTKRKLLDVVERMLGGEQFDFSLRAVN